MGTHPIFESDFDCLTEQSEKKCQAEEDRKNQRKKRPLNQWLAANGKKADVDDHPEKSAKNNYTLLFLSKNRIHRLPWISKRKRVMKLTTRNFWGTGGRNSTKRPKKVSKMPISNTSLRNRRIDDPGSSLRTIELSLALVLTHCLNLPDLSVLCVIFE